MYDIYHETICENLEKILQSGKMLIKSLAEKNCTKSVQGSLNRRLAKDPTVTLRDSGFFTEYDEVDAVYFRFKKRNDAIEKINENSDCVIIFDENLVKNHKTVINTEENFGFMIAKNGELGNSQFSDEPGYSFYDPKNMDILENINFSPDCTEIACLENVDLKKYCKKNWIGFRNTFGKNFTFDGNF